MVYFRRSFSAALMWLVVLTTGVTWAGATSAAADPCSGGRTADISLGQTVGADPLGNTEFTLTITNNGPSCLPGVQVRIDLSGDYLSFTSINPSSWTCPAGPIPGPTSVTCTLKATIGVGGGGNTAVVAVVASAGATSHAVAGAEVVDPDCSPALFCDGAGSNNESWAVLGTSLSFGAGPPQPSVPGISINRPNTAALTAALLAPGSPAAARDGNGDPVSPPCSPNCVTNRQWIVDTPATPGGKGGVMTMAIMVVTTAKPAAVIYQFDDALYTWRTYGACKGPKVLPCVESVSFDKMTGVATITVLTSEFSHWTK